MRRINGVYVSVLLGALFALCLPAWAVPTVFEASWEAKLPDTSKGYGVMLAPEATAPVTDWVEPSASGVLALGFDTDNPPSKNIFNADGNIYNRPQREISLHWNGTEIANRLCPVELKGAQAQSSVKWRVEAVVGGAEITVRVGDTTVYDHYFLPEYRLAEGSTLRTGGEAVLSSIKTRWSGKGKESAAPTRVTAFDKQVNNKDHHHLIADAVSFPAETKGVGRVVCTLTLAATPQGLDPWDRAAAVYLYDEKGERFEILRYMTPYRKGWQWKMDVTDYLPLLTGKKKMEVACETWGEGWLVSVDFDFYPGELKRVPYKVLNLWNTTATIGEANKPLDKSIPARTIAIDKATKQARVRMTVTGHGQAPNTDNAAEFVSLWRKLIVGETAFTDTLWKEDNYLNPCRPQGGTWKFDRAGWAPGDVVTPWIVDITKEAKPGKEVPFRYEIQPFVNKTPDNGNPARHIIEAQLVLYK